MPSLASSASTRPTTESSSTGDQDHPLRKFATGQKIANNLVFAARTPVEHAFALKIWRVLTKLRNEPACGTNLLRARLFLANFKIA